MLEEQIMQKNKDSEKSSRTVSVYNTLNQCYEDVEVRVEVYTTFRRTKWNIDKNNAKHAYHSILFSDMKCPGDISVEDFNEFASDDYNPENILIEKERDLMGSAIKVLDQCATLTQRRRFLLHYYEGLSTRQIALLENVNQSSVLESLNAVSEKIKKYFQNFDE
jgi:DNA-directed RNA polymerase specialized sigma24 family protein